MNHVESVNIEESAFFWLPFDLNRRNAIWLLTVITTIGQILFFKFLHRFFFTLINFEKRTNIKYLHILISKYNIDLKLFKHFILNI